MLSDRRFRFGAGVALLAAACMGPSALAQWVEFADESATRLAGVPTGLGLEDPDEKDYAWGDFDHDGDIDLAVARKQPFTSPGKRVNALWINENGSFVDRTSEFATASDVSGDLGFNTPTNDRDIVAVDVNNDGWLDLVTAPAISPDDPKHVGHPRVYRNLGCAGSCDGTDAWLGFRFENDRIPTMVSASGQPGNPCLCHVAAGDVTGDGYADLWLIDYDSGAGCGGSTDFQNKLLINQGPFNPGFFTDATNSRFFGQAPDGPYPNSAFGASGSVIDLNDDGMNDLIKQYASHVGNAFNDPFDQGFFETYDSPYGGAAYFMNTADLNNDNLPDLIISDDGADRYLLNQGTGGDEITDFLSFTFSFNHTGVGGPAGDDGFSGNSIAADLDKDGWDDVVITDADVDVPNCSRRTHIFKNLGGVPGEFVTIQEQTTGSTCCSTCGNPATCLVTGIPANQLTGTHDAAIFDIDGDGWLDMILGRCNSTTVYMNQPPVGPAGGVDGDSSRTMLLANNHPGSEQISLQWGDSCSDADSDFNVYEGGIGNFQSHEPATCSTLGGKTLTFLPKPGDRYFLVVPNNGTFEGSYGVASSGAARQQGLAACQPQSVGACD